MLQLRPKLTRSTLGLAAVIAGCLTLNVVWLVHFRLGYITGWDESGYLSIGLNDSHSLVSRGPLALIWEYEKQTVEAPLVPLLIVPITSVFGAGVFQGLLLQPILAAFLALVTFAVARRLVSDGWALLAALSVSALPVVTDYSRQFHFAVGASVFLMAALWALFRSDQLTRTRWVYAFGVFCGLLVLARTMTVAYVPALAIAALAMLFARRDDRRRRALHLLGAAGAGLFCAASWYLHNWGPVWDYLTSSGYGSQSGLYGESAGMASWAYWSKELREILSQIYLPAAAALAACFAVALAAWLGDRSWRRLHRPSLASLASPECILALVVIEGYLALTSSTNEGSAFALPWLPALVVLAVVAAARLRFPAARASLVAALIVVSAGNLLMKSGWVAPLATPRAVAVPAFGTVTVLDGRGPDKAPVSDAGYPVPAPNSRLPAVDRRWLPFSRLVTGFMVDYAKARGQLAVPTLGMNNQLFNQTWISLADSLWFHADVLPIWIGPKPPGSSVVLYRKKMSTRPANFIVTSQGGPEDIRFNHVRIEAAARSLGYRKVKTYRMPDGELLWLWWRSQPTMHL